MTAPVLSGYALRWTHVRDGHLMYVASACPNWSATTDLGRAYLWPTADEAVAELDRWEAVQPGVTTNYGAVLVVPIYETRPG